MAVQSELKTEDLLRQRHVCQACPAIIERALMVSGGDSKPFIRVSIKNISDDSEMILTGATFKIVYHLKKTRQSTPDPVTMHIRFPDFFCSPGDSAACRITVPELEGKLEYYEIFIDRVRLDAGYTVTFDDDDYIIPEKQPKNKFTAALYSLFADKRKFAVALTAAALLLTGAVAIAIILPKIVATMPEKSGTSYSEYIAAHDYDGAIAIAEKAGEDMKVDSLRCDAAEYYFRQGDVEIALKYASAAENFDYSEYYAQIFGYYSDSGSFQSGLNFALLHEPDGETESAAFTEAFNSFLADAVFKYLTEGNTTDALRYASYATSGDTSGDSDTQIADMLNSAIQQRVDSDSWDDAYNFAALVSNTYPDDAVYDPETIAAKAVDHYIYIRDFESALYFADQISDNTSYHDTALTYAIVYYTSDAGCDYDKAIAYAEELGDSSVISDTLMSAVNYYLSRWDTRDRAKNPDGLDFIEAAETIVRRATGSTAEKLNVAILNARALMYYETDSYSLLLKCLDNINSTDSGTADVFFTSVPRSFLRKNIADMWERMSAYSKRVYNARTLDAYKFVVGVSESGAVECSSLPLDWAKVLSVAVSEHSRLALTSGGSVLAESDNLYGEGNVSGWVGIVDVAAGLSHSAGLTSSGTVVAAGSNEYGQCSVSSWSTIVSIAAGNSHTVGLKSDGTVVAAGLNPSGQCDVGDWTDIVAVEAGTYHTVGLKRDGTVVCAGDDNFEKTNTGGWTNIVAIAAGDCMTVGLKSDGTVVMTGSPVYGSAGDVSKWTGIVDIAAGAVAVYGLKSDGTVVSTGDGAGDVSGFSGIAAPSKYLE